MTALEISPEDRRSIALEILDGSTPEGVSRRRKVPQSTVMAIARSYGWPDYDQMRRSLASGQAPVDALLLRAEKMPRAVDELAQARRAINTLKARVDQIEQETLAELDNKRAIAAKDIEISRLEERLAKAKAQRAELGS